MDHVSPSPDNSSGRRQARWLIAELLVLAIWTIVTTRPFQDWNASTMPAGHDFMLTTLPNHLWEHAESCGPCALWNGDIRGGAPAFVDILGASLHPIVIVTTLLWGVVNGAKATLIICFFLAGLGQWLLSFWLGLGRATRLWSGAMAIAAGSMFGPMAGGLVPMVIANAIFALLFASSFRLTRGGGRRHAVLVGALFAMLIVAGQGYVQIGFAMAAPVFALLFLNRTQNWQVIGREFGLAAGLGILLAGPLLVPLAHFWPEIAKHSDITFARAQPLPYLPLNLVISDPAYYLDNALSRQPYPEFYINYIGWLAVFLAIVGVAVLVKREQSRLVSFFGVYVVLIYWIASAAPFRWLYNNAGSFEELRAFAAGVRTPSLISGMVVCPLLALGAIGLDALLRPPRPEHRLGLTFGDLQSNRPSHIPLDHRPIIVGLAILALFHVHSFGRNWISTAPMHIARDDPTLMTLDTPDLQWVQPPYGEMFWIPRAIQRGYKVAFAERPWDLKARPLPQPVLVVSRRPEEGLTTVQQLAESLWLYRAPPGNEYAAITHADGSRTVCVAHGEGGDIDVTCDAPQPGRLTVMENEAAGWQATVAGEDRSIAGTGPWLSVDVPAGSIDVRLRYRPWDVPVGIALMIVGLIVATFWLIWPNRWPSPG